MSYKVEILRGALKQIKKLSPELQERIQVRIDKLATEPRPNGVKKLKGRENAYRIRVGNYRICYNILRRRQRFKHNIYFFASVGAISDSKPLPRRALCRSVCCYRR